MGETRKSSRGRGMKPRINLIDFQPGDERPDIGVYALNRAGEPDYTTRVDAEGRSTCPKTCSRSLTGSYRPSDRRFRVP